MDDDPGRIGRFRGNSLVGHFAGFWIEVVGIDTLALRFRGVGADEREVMRVGCRAWRGAPGERENKNWRSNDGQSEYASSDFHGHLVYRRSGKKRGTTMRAPVGLFVLAQTTSFPLRLLPGEPLPLLPNRHRPA